jgi:hypothetical protein
MSLSSEEYREHLQSTSLRAGFRFDDVVLPDQRLVAVNGLRLRYLDSGILGKSSILFLHGGALTAHTWDLCCLALREDTIAWRSTSAAMATATGRPTPIIRSPPSAKT